MNILGKVSAVLLSGLVCMISGCSVISGSDADAITLEITYSDEDEDKLAILNAEMNAPDGTVISINNSADHELSSQEAYSFLIVSEIYLRQVPEAEAPGADLGIEVSMYTPFIDITSSFEKLPQIGAAPEGEIEEYAYFVEPGVYTLREGEEFVLVQIEDKVYTIEVRKS